jgi:hypothetical protein
VDQIYLEAMITIFNGVQLVLLYRIAGGVQEAARVHRAERAHDVD